MKQNNLKKVIHKKRVKKKILAKNISMMKKNILNAKKTLAINLKMMKKNIRNAWKNNNKMMMMKNNKMIRMKFKNLKKVINNIINLKISE